MRLVIIGTVLTAANCGVRIVQMIVYVSVFHLLVVCVHSVTVYSVTVLFHLVLIRRSSCLQKAWYHWLSCPTSISVAHQYPNQKGKDTHARNQDAVSDNNEDDLFRLYRCNGVDVEILCMLQKLCGYHQIFWACIINKLISVNHAWLLSWEM